MKYLDALTDPDDPDDVQLARVARREHTARPAVMLLLLRQRELQPVVPREVLQPPLPHDPDDPGGPSYRLEPEFHSWLCGRRPLRGLGLLHDIPILLYEAGGCQPRGEIRGLSFT